MSRKIMIAGNWKMNNTVGESVSLAEDILKDGGDEYKVDVVVAPVFTAIKPVFDALSDSSVQVAGQNVFWERSGAYTGEISPSMLKEAGCKWVIVGHSERRQYFSETDETVRQRTAASLAGGLKVIVCVGETLEERESGKTFEVLDTQVQGALEGMDEASMAKIVVAYEPVWAIGTGKTASSDQADEAHAHIRKKLEAMFGAKTAEHTRILYGGSVKPSNAVELLGRENVDGALVGGASLKSSDFCAIIKAGVEIHNGKAD